LFRFLLILPNAGPGGWHFITLPVKHAATIKALLRSPRPGWGSLSVTATIGSSSWKTSIFPEKGNRKDRDPGAIACSASIKRSFSMKQWNLRE
jgi:hypothetical protein